MGSCGFVFLLTNCYDGCHIIGIVIVWGGFVSHNKQEVDGRTDGRTPEMSRCIRLKLNLFKSDTRVNVFLSPVSRCSWKLTGQHGHTLWTFIPSCRWHSSKDLYPNYQNGFWIFPCILLKSFKDLPLPFLALWMYYWMDLKQWILFFFFWSILIHMACCY